MQESLHLGSSKLGAMSHDPSWQITIFECMDEAPTIPTYVRMPGEGTHANIGGVLLHIGAEIRKLRLKRNLSQERLAELARLQRNYVGMVERGECNIRLIRCAHSCIDGCFHDGYPSVRTNTSDWHSLS